MSGGFEPSGRRPFFTRTRRRTRRPRPWAPLARGWAAARALAEGGLARVRAREGEPRARNGRRRMTLRGRLTIAAGVLLVLGALASLGFSADDEPVPAATKPAAASPVAAPPSVASAPSTAAPPPVASAPPLAPLPDELWAPPVGRGNLEVPRTADGLRVEYTLDSELTRQIWKVLDRGRVSLGHVLLMDPRTGELLAYVSTDPERFPPAQAYPAASLVKVVTAAALLDKRPGAAGETCRFAGDPYRLRARHIDPPSRGGNRANLRKALATSNNKCFAQYAVHHIGRDSLVRAIDRFGFLTPPARTHRPGRLTGEEEDRLALGKLGSGLDGLRITPLHAVQLAAVLAHGKRVAPRWVARVEGDGGLEMPLAPTPEPVRVLTPGLAKDLREMLVDTTRRGTARKAFRTRRGHPLLKGIDVAGKTGSLNGRDPTGRYEWFIGVAPADEPKLAVATVAVQGPLYWMSASQLAAEVLKVAFCPKGVCNPEPLQVRSVTAHRVGG